MRYWFESPTEESGIARGVLEQVGLHPVVLSVNADMTMWETEEPNSDQWGILDSYWVTLMIWGPQR